MNTQNHSRFLLICTLLLLATMTTPLPAAPRDAQWKKVDEAINQGLPKSAIDALEPIITAATAEKAYAEAAKAIARKIALQGNIEGNKPEEKITRLETEIGKAPAELKPILTTILANWYWHYFQQNRWRFMNRTATAVAPGSDFTTWDLPRLFAEIDKHFTAALAADAVLKATPIATFDALLQKGSLPDTYRPTLYDFIAHDALHFYTSGEQAAARPSDAFEIAADSPIFSGVAPFLAWQPATTDTNAPALKAIRLYQELLRFHAKDANPTALLDADLARLVWGRNVARGETKDARFKAAMKVFVDQWADHELSARALYEWAQALHNEGDLVEARTLALRGAKVFPKSVGGKQCKNLVSGIEAKSAQINIERIWNAPWPKISVHYRNVTAVYFRAVAYDWDVFLQRRHSRPEYLNDNERKELLAKKPTLEWSAKLPATTDYKQRTEQLPAPTQLKPGFYFLVSSHDPKFGDADNMVSYTDIWVSDLALIVRPRNGQIEGFVLEANSGEPVKNADVLSWQLTNQGDRVAAPKLATDTNGFFSFATQPGRGYLLKAVHQGRQIGSSQDIYSYARGTPRPNTQTIFFTDRALYRPGQFVQYKGICLAVDQERDNYETLAGQTLTVIFADPNGKEIARQETRCNDYGSFTGSFTAPRDRLMGAMRLFVQNGPNGSARVQVEEYKRPKFQVTLAAPKTAAKLNETVSLTGSAASYTGAAIDGAKVKYRVIRNVRWPVWWGWFYWGPPRNTSSQEIASGTATTKNDGTFVIEFPAKPDLSIPEKDEPTFVFSVHADVTDSSGETRSADRTVNVGYTALAATLTAADWLVEAKPTDLRIATRTLDGEPALAEGNVKIYRLKQPEQVQRPALADRGRTESEADLSNPNSWPLGEVVAERGFTTDKEGNLTLAFKLGVGAYRALLETQDRFGKKVTARLPLQILNPDDTRLAIRIPHLVAAPEWTAEPGKDFVALWGTGYDAGRAFIEIEHRGRMLQRYWTKPGDTQAGVKHAVTEAMRGGFTLHVTQVRENRAYLDSRRIDVPWSNKNLDIRWEHFTSKLQPNQKETWTAVISGPGANKAVAEMAATLYDESLDAFLPHRWLNRFSFFRLDRSSGHASFANQTKYFQHIRGYWRQDMEGIEMTYRSFPPDLTVNLWGYGYFGRGRGLQMAPGMMAPMMRKSAAKGEAQMEMAASPPPMAAAVAMDAAPMNAAGEGLAQNRAQLGATDKQASAARRDAGPGGGAGDGGQAPDLSKISARKNLNESAFFFPQLVSDKNGEVKLEFTMPEALTRWRFLGFAHDRQLRSGLIEAHAVTAKDIMVQPNPPRFLREGDALEFTVKVSNQTDTPQTGRVRLTLNDAATLASADAALGNTSPEQSFTIAAKESRSFSWRLKVPDSLGFLTYKAVGASAKASDGEEGFLPVLPRRILVTESLPLPIRNAGTRQFDFKKLQASGVSDTLRHQSLTVQMVSQPAWYAVMALPYLMEFPHECSEQIFGRLYANALARSIAVSDPKIRRIFDLWRNTPALDSPLEKNQDLKGVMLEETPWFRQAMNESQARKNVGVLFEDNRMNNEINRALKQLTEMQLPDGQWPWFPGGRGNDFITLHITTGFGRLRHLGVDLNAAPAIRSLTALDAWIDRTYREILKHGRKDDNHLSSTIALYLYGRSFFLKDKAVDPAHKEAVDYFLGQARKHWLALANRQSQGHLAIALKRVADFTKAADPTPVAILRSIKERSVSNEELGMFWRDTEFSWWWYHAPIETQALMIEAFAEVTNDVKAVEDCQVWLLKQKQTQDWKTTKATADAVYALLLRGRNQLASDALVEVSVGGHPLKPQKAEAGTGFYEKRFTGPEIQPALGQITVKKIDAGVSWGSVHWQYLEDMTKVTPHGATPLKLRKTLYTKTVTKAGPVLEPIRGPLAVGDELVVRIELRTDRDMEYVHLKDQRGSGLEPMNVISRYRYQDGLGYYETTRDTASHFFIDYLPKGVYVFEYSTRVVHRGDYQSGIADIQCMYAPEFNSHSESFGLSVK